MYSTTYFTVKLLFRRYLSLLVLPLHAIFSSDLTRVGRGEGGARTERERMPPPCVQRDCGRTERDDKFLHQLFTVCICVYVGTYIRIHRYVYVGIYGYTASLIPFHDSRKDGPQKVACFLSFAKFVLVRVYTGCFGRCRENLGDFKVSIHHRPSGLQGFSLCRWSADWLVCSGYLTLRV